MVDDLKVVAGMEVYVGIPEVMSRREMRKEERKTKGEALGNAQIAFLMTHGVRSLSMRQEMEPTEKESGYGVALQMYIHSHGSPLHSIPARPIIEPAIEAEDNKEAIAKELGLAAKSVLDKKPGKAKIHLKRAGMTGRNAAVEWFTDPRNNWPPNAPSTIKEKGSERPLIDTGALRASITYVVKGETSD